MRDFVGKTIFDVGAIVYHPEADPGSVYRYDGTVEDEYEGPCWQLRPILTDLPVAVGGEVYVPLSETGGWLEIIPGIVKDLEPPSADNDWDLAAQNLVGS